MDTSANPLICFDCTLIPYCLTCNSQTACLTCQTGYRPSGTGCALIPCNDPHCILCTNSNAGQCRTCNYNNSYYVNSGSCSYCNPATNKFINTTNTTSYPCVFCTPTNCITCSSLNACSSCDTANGY